MSAFKQKYTLQERIEKYNKQLGSHPDRVVLIVEKHPKSSLPELTNPRFLCDKNYKFNIVKKMLEKKVHQKLDTEDKNINKTSFFVFIGKNLPNGQQTMGKLYENYKDNDGFLYVQYSEAQTF